MSANEAKEIIQFERVDDGHVEEWTQATFPAEIDVKTTPQMTRFRDAKVCNYWLQIRIDDHRIQSDYKYKKRTTKSRRKDICTWYCVCVVK